MNKKRGIIAIVLFIFIGLIIFTFANPKEDLGDGMERNQKETQYLSEAKTAVELAEKTRLQSDIDAAQSKINLLPIGKDKRTLQERLDEILVKIEDDDVITNPVDEEIKEDENTTPAGNTTNNNNNTGNNTPQVVKYTVSFNTDGGNVVANQTVTTGTKATQPANPTKAGYKFLGWYVGDVAYNFNSTVTSHMTITARWEWIKVYTIKVEDVNAGDSYSPEKKVRVYCDGVDITSTVSEISGVASFYYQTTEGVILANRNELTASSYSIKLNSGVIVTATKIG